MSLFYFSAVLIGLVSAFYYYFTRTFNYWKARNVPGPEPMVFFGNIKESVIRKKNIGLIIHEWYNMFPNEPVVGVYRMTSPCILIRDLDILKYIFIKDFEVFSDRGIQYSEEGLGQNLFHADGQLWAALRNRFSCMFTAGKLKNMFYLIDEGANRFVDQISLDSQKKQEFEIHSLFQSYTATTIAACAFGINYDDDKVKLKAMGVLDQIFSDPSYAIELDMMFPKLLRALNLSIFPASVKSFFKQLVDNIIAQRNGEPSGRQDFMDLILELRQLGEVNSPKHGKNATTLEITDDIIAAQAFLFYAAGYETSSTTMAYMVYELALHPEIQDKIRAEIEDVMQANDGKVTYDAVKDMKYLNKTYSETLRVHSIVEPLQRKAKRDYQIPGTNVVIEKDTIVLISPRGIHYDEKYYPDPEVFNPERFDAEEVGKRHPCAYLPFGLGQRNCLGMRFGRLQSLLCIIKILTKFKVEATENTERNLKVAPKRAFLGPDGGILVRFAPIK